jgi:ribosome biogenesis protein Nip4
MKMITVRADAGEAAAAAGAVIVGRHDELLGFGVDRLRPHTSGRRCVLPSGFGSSLRAADEQRIWTAG